MKIILILLIVNILTAALARAIQGGRFTFDKEDFPDYDGKLILIAGMLSQPESAYRLIDFPLGGKAYLDFSVFGFNPKNAGKQLGELAREKDLIVGVSVGCKAMILSDTAENRRVFVNPMTHSIILKANFQMLIEYLSPLAEIVSYGLGWLSFIPFIKSDTGDHYSIALLVDQLFWMYYGDPETKNLDGIENSGVILSSDDEFLENDIIADIYKNADEIITIKTRHGHLANPHVSDDYDEAINYLLLAH